MREGGIVLQTDGGTHTWLLLGGTLMLVFGTLAMMGPAVAAIPAESAAGWLLLLGGLFGLGLGIFGPPVGSTRWWWNLGASLFATGAGSLLLWQPTASPVPSTILLAAFLVASASAKALIGISYRHTINPGWHWIIASAIADLVLAGGVLANWPPSWPAGVMLGFSLISGGLLLLGAAFQGAPQHQRPEATTL